MLVIELDTELRLHTVEHFLWIYDHDTLHMMGKDGVVPNSSESDCTSVALMWPIQWVWCDLLYGIVWVLFCLFDTWLTYPVVAESQSGVGVFTRVMKLAV